MIMKRDYQMHGCESWTLQARHISRLQAVDMKEGLGQEVAVDTVWRRQSRWLHGKGD